MVSHFSHHPFVVVLVFVLGIIFPTDFLVLNLRLQNESSCIECSDSVLRGSEDFLRITTKTRQAAIAAITSVQLYSVWTKLEESVSYPNVHLEYFVNKVLYLVNFQKIQFVSVLFRNSNLSFAMKAKRARAPLTITHRCKSFCCTY